MGSLFFLYVVLCSTASIASYRRQIITTASGPRDFRFLTPYVAKDPLILPYFYWPNYGYEPYWADGDWMIRDPLKDLGPNDTTTKIPLVCGVECNFMSMRIKEVCAARSGYHNHHGCWKGECIGQLLKDITYDFKTFKTYCDFLHAQCQNEYNRWGLLYRGRCIYPQDKFLKPLWPRFRIFTRMQNYLSTLEDTFDKLYEKNKG